MDETSIRDGTTPSGTRVELRFRHDLADYTAMMKQVRWSIVERVYGILPPIVGGLLVGGLAFGGQMWLASRVPALGGIGGDILFAIVVGVAVCFGLRFVGTGYLRTHFEGQPIGMGETVLIADARGLTSTSVGVTTSFPWTSVISVQETKDHVLLWYSRYAGMIVPNRVFSSSGQFDQFMSLVRSGAPAVGARERR